MEKAWQARRTCLRFVERLGASHVAIHRPVGQDADERREESSGVGNSCHERGLAQWPGKRTATLHCTSSSFRVATPEMAKGVENWRRYALGVDSRASLIAEGSLKELQVIDRLSDTESSELLAKVTSVDVEDEVKCWLVTKHVQDDTSRRRLVMHVSSLDTFLGVSEEEVLGRAQRTFEERRHSGVCKVKRRHEDLIADADGNTR